MPEPTALADRDAATAAALFPTMSQRVPVTMTTPPGSALAAALFPTMQPDTLASAPLHAEGADTDALPTATIPEAHWARVDDVDAWEAEVMASPLAASLPAARDFLQQHAPRELVQMLEQSGYGSNPDVIKFVADLAAKFTSGGIR